MKNRNVSRLASYTNILDILGIAIILIITFVFQFFLKEIPCPLCILQRIGLLITSLGLLLNLAYQFRPSHYSLSLLGALLTAFIALRQVALHVTPGSGAYGTTFWGFHMYTWSFILAIIIVLATSLALGIDRQYSVQRIKTKIETVITKALFALIFFLIITNLVSVLMECGLSSCPENPTRYYWKA